MMSTNTEVETERSPGGVRSHRQRVRLTAEYSYTTRLQSQRKNEENLRDKEPGKKGNKFYSTFPEFINKTRSPDHHFFVLPRC